LELDDAGFIQFTDQIATPELTREHMDDQARLLADFAVENQIQFLDLTPVFQDEAGLGAELYYPFDTHWNQLGHDLAAGTISKYLEERLPALRARQ
jgi:acetyltransferase AlgX (SGNH hydrolase-like protein)